ncbi:Solute carrier family 22 member 5 High-affinity sodium-dependent carnitine cotransporter [Collichthys lucidus]|uniref:Solute carrier family 22 member 5 High-affinity sodium-dependent carnitine cotransporter n=1 Tax=Collichthys lucidus TaxID=240159 RepID=A0A4U5V5C6_COLLU|nr:Solute carrier family 22 member 5 High-affinity sodium-dependent carnitine cotransporter [Collichthys lucidus]
MGDYDEDTAFLGQTGPYFWTTFFLLNTVFVSTGFNGLYIVFVGAAPKHHCLIPDVNLTDEWRNAIIPFTEVDGKEVKNQCSRYKLDVVRNLSAEGYIPGRDVNLTSLEKEGCLDGWNYSKEIYQSNIVTEVWEEEGCFHLSCSPECLSPASVLLLLMEDVLHHVPLCRSLSDIHLYFCICTWFIPESPRWLITRGRVEEAEVIVRDAARKNKVEAPQVIFKEFELQTMLQSRSYTMLDILKSKNLRCITLMCLLLWMAINIGYFGLSLNTSNLSGNPFMNCFLSATTEVPAYVVSTWLLSKCPRRALLSSFLVIGGGVLLLIQFIPDSFHYVALALEMTGKFGFTMAFSMVYIYTAEIYPTVLRNVGMGMCSSAARIGSITAPYVIYLGTYNKVLPYILMGSLTIASSVVNLFLPETFNRDLPETVEQMQECQGLCTGSKNKKYVEGSGNPTVQRQYFKALPYILMGTLAIFGAFLSLLLPETYRKVLPETISQIQKICSRVSAQLSLNIEAFKRCVTSSR